MSKEVKVIWRYVLVFADSNKEFEDTCMELDSGFLYIGAVDNIPHEIAVLIAEYHPNCFKYFERALMPLYKGYNKQLKGGTENPVLAISSLSKKTFIHIKRIIDDLDYYPIK